MTPTLVPFEPWHIKSIINRDPGMRGQSSIEQNARHGPAYTIMLGDGVLACGGVVLPWEGIGIAWLVLAQDISKHGIWLTRIVRRILQDTVRAHGLYRLEAVVLAESEKNRAWIESLGFTQEKGVARAYIPGRRDAVRYEFIC